MITPAELPRNREQLTTMIRELQSNNHILDGLSNSYRVFRFTGGSVSRTPWEVGAMTSYLRSPFAADRFSSAATERYLHLAESIMDLGQTTKADARPRSLRLRFEMAGQFDRESSEIRALGSTLESAMTTLAAELISARAPGDEN